VTARAIVVPDGMADEPLDELEGRTPLEVARTPHMDALARRGTVGLVRTIPQGMPAGSDVANLSVLGYDPRAVYTGRAPLEAASMGVELGPNDVAYRCNFVTIVDGVMRDNTAGGIGGREAERLIAALAERFADGPFEFSPGVGYRHLVVWRGGAEVDCTPPHDILDRPVSGHLPGDRPHTTAGGDENAGGAPGGEPDADRQEVAAARLRELMIAAREVVDPLRPGTDIWLWGEGRAPRVPALLEQRGLRGAVVAAVDLVRGIATCAGMDVLDVPGATGDLDTDYAAKGSVAAAAVDRYDLVLVHVEAPDEAGHQGDVAAKVTAIERVDEEVLGPLLRRGDVPGVLVLPDHATPIRLRTHTDPPVPFVFAAGGAAVPEGRDVPAGGARSFSERDAAAGQTVADGPRLMDWFLEATG